MRVTTISYEKCHNLGNYEHEKIRVDAEVADGDDVRQALRDLRTIVDSDIERADIKRSIAYEMEFGNFSRMAVGEQWDDPDGVKWTVKEKTSDSVTMVIQPDESEPATELILLPLNAKSWRRSWVDDLDYDPMAED